MSNKVVPKGLAYHQGSLGLGDVHLVVVGEVVCHLQDVSSFPFPCSRHK